MTGIPVFNVNSNCSTARARCTLAAQAIRAGVADSALALASRRCSPGSLGATFTDREQPMARHIDLLAQISEVRFPPAVDVSGQPGPEHMREHGSEPIHFARIGHKNHRHSVKTTRNAQSSASTPLEEIEQAPMIYEPLTKLQCSPTPTCARRGSLGERRPSSIRTKLAARSGRESPGRR